MFQITAITKMLQLHLMLLQTVAVMKNCVKPHNYPERCLNHYFTDFKNCNKVSRRFAKDHCASEQQSSHRDSSRMGGRLVGRTRSAACVPTAGP